MGMAASQGRLLFMTARLSNNEFEQQCVAYAKQTLADSSQAANDKYLDALKATHYQLLTGYNGSTPTYEDVSYNILTGMNTVAVAKQYIVQDNKGQILVTDKIADAFESSNGDYNKFLEKVGNLSQIEQDKVTAQDVHEAWDRYLTAVGFSNYDKADGVPDKEHILGFSFNQEFFNQELATDKSSLEYPTYKSAYVEINDQKVYLYKGTKGASKSYYMKNYEVKAQAYTKPDGTTAYKAYYQEDTPEKDAPIYPLSDIEVRYDETNQCFMYKYSDILSDDEDTPDEMNKLYICPFKNNDGKMICTIEEDTVLSYSTENSKYIWNYNQNISFNLIEESNILYYQGTCTEHRNLYDYAMELSKKHALGTKYEKEYKPDEISYYKNIYNQMISKGYTTYTKMREEKYMSAEEPKENVAYKNSEWLIRQLKAGKLTISYYSSVDKEFVATTLDDDESITEKEDTKKIAIAEQEYKNSMDRIESEDKRFDMQLNKLESEHSALTTEYEAVVKVISKNVEKSFNIFNA